MVDGRRAENSGGGAPDSAHGGAGGLHGRPQRRANDWLCGGCLPAGIAASTPTGYREQRHLGGAGDGGGAPAGNYCVLVRVGRCPIAGALGRGMDARGQRAQWAPVWRLAGGRLAVDAISGAAKIVLRGIGGASPQKWRRHHRPPPTTEQQTRHGAQGTPNGVWGRAPSGGLGAGPHPPRVPFGRGGISSTQGRGMSLTTFPYAQATKAGHPAPSPSLSPNQIQ